MRLLDWIPAVAGMTNNGEPRNHKLCQDATKTSFRASEARPGIHEFSELPLEFIPMHMGAAIT